MLAVLIGIFCPVAGFYSMLGGSWLTPGQWVIVEHLLLDGILASAWGWADLQAEVPASSLPSSPCLISMPGPGARTVQRTIPAGPSVWMHAEHVLNATLN